MQLHEWQNSFQNAVLGGAVTDELPLQKTLPRELSIGIYANAYRERLHEALRSNFPALHRLLGDGDFAEMAYAFAAAHPSETNSIRWFGAKLPHYLREHQPFSTQPIFGELAQFEWALRHTVDAADGARIDAAYLQSLDAEQWVLARFDLHPSLTILRFEWNAPQVWQSLDADAEPPPPAKFDSYWLVYRDNDFLSQWRSADAYEGEAVRLWAQGKTFGAICERLAEKLNDEESAVVRAASFMRTWIEQGLLVYPATPL